MNCIALEFGVIAVKPILVLDKVPLCSNYGSPDNHLFVMVHVSIISREDVRCLDVLSDPLTLHVSLR